MARKRLDKTLADYLAIAVTPVLIMLLVGSLVFFLQELFPGVRYESRVRWILFWFVFGMVLISRIAIESGRAQSGMFTLGLAGATALAIFKFVPNAPWVPIGCLAIIWWCTDKLTWDCTLIDESEDASGEGLLQVAGVDDGADLTQSSDSAEAGSPDTDEAATGDGQRTPLWKRLFLNVGEREGRPHAPGLWVVYFSLAALPIFGFGQTMIPAGNAAARGYAFNLLLAYVAAGLGLLLLTSFLGLRRYLRQRQLQMPATMAATWVGMGATIAVGILIVALLIPRPQGDYSVVDLIDRAGDELQEAADVAFLNDEGGEGDGQRTGPASEDAEQDAAESEDQQGQAGGQQEGDQTGENAQQSDQGQADPQSQGDGQSSGQSQQQQSQQQSQQESQQQGDSQQSDQGQPSEQQNGQQQGSQQSQNGQQQSQQSDAQQSGQRQNGDQSQSAGDQSQQRQGDDGSQQTDQESAEESSDGEAESADADSSSPQDVSPPEMSSVFTSIGDLFKWVMYGLLAIAGLWLLYVYRDSIANFFTRLWNELLGLFGRRPAVAETVDEALEPEALPRPFAAFQNPFASGAASKHSPSELVRYTFEALQAWGFENGCPRSPDQTPMEYGQLLRTRKLSFASEANDVSQLYARVAYAGYRAQPDNLPLLEKLWRKLGQVS